MCSLCNVYTHYKVYVCVCVCVCVQKKCTFGWCMGFSGVRLMIFSFVFMCGNACDSTVFTVKYTNFVLVYQNILSSPKYAYDLKCFSFSYGICFVFGPWLSLWWGFKSTGVFELRMSSPWPTPNSEGQGISLCPAPHWKPAWHGWPYHQLACCQLGIQVYWCSQAPSPSKMCLWHSGDNMKEDLNHWSH